MSKARLIITAVVLEGRTKREVARDYEVSRYWVHQLVERYRAEARPLMSPAPDARTPAPARSRRRSRTRSSGSARN